MTRAAAFLVGRGSLRPLTCGLPSRCRVSLAYVALLHNRVMFRILHSTSHSDILYRLRIKCFARQRQAVCLSVCFAKKTGFR